MRRSSSWLHLGLWPAVGSKSGVLRTHVWARFRLEPPLFAGCDLHVGSSWRPRLASKQLVTSFRTVGYRTAINRFNGMRVLES